jgi:hypothetical protein
MSDIHASVLEKLSLEQPLLKSSVDIREIKP